MYGYIYKITNKVNGKLYIGKTKNTIQRRFSRHCFDAIQNKPRHKHLKLYSAMRKYGIANFMVEQLDIADTAEELDIKEQFWIKELHTFIDDPLCNGYNMTIGGDGGHWSLESQQKWYDTKTKNDSFKHSDQTKLNISKANKGKPKSILHRQHLSENHYLKTTHTLYYKDGHIEYSSDSIKTLGERLGVTAIQLRRASEVGEFRCGDFFLLDLINFEQAFRHKYRYSSEKIILDPDTGLAISLSGLRSKYRHHPELYNYNYPRCEFSPEYQIKFELFKKTFDIN